jgi:hypothetical protein
MPAMAATSVSAMTSSQSRWLARGPLLGRANL